MNTENIVKLAQLKPLVTAKVLSIAAFASELEVSERHARRLLQVEPRVRTAHNRLTQSTRELVVSFREDYPTRNCQWISELVSDRIEGTVSRPSVWRILKKAGLLEKEATGIRVARSRFEAKECGDLVQMDTTWGHWWGGKKLCLILLLDDYSRYIVSARFTEHDGFWQNSSLIKDTITKRGTWRTLYTDNASFFKPVRHSGSRFSKKEPTEYVSEISRALREVGSTHVAHAPYTPQGKGKVERIFRFIQERFVPTISEAMTLAEINESFTNWTTWYHESHVNRTTGTTPQKRWNPERFTPLPAERNLDDIFCRKDSRKVDSCNQFSYQGTIYTIPTEYCLVAYRIDIHIQEDATIRIWHNDAYVCTVAPPPKPDSITIQSI